MDELKRLHGYVSMNSVEARLKVTRSGELVLHASNYTVNLSQAISELVDERIEKAIERLRTEQAVEAARGGHE